MSIPRSAARAEGHRENIEGLGGPNLRSVDCSGLFEDMALISGQPCFDRSLGKRPEDQAKQIMSFRLCWAIEYRTMMDNGGAASGAHQ